ncbi:zinc finger protein 76 [Fopius arisanus]|uniref:Zinc finger protein 76 n=2 Tax=Fopius arisanus TaxID=64838 RepID=A0A0C9PTC1_9HYME|nr:PREDICTED: zinc finger protein 76-like [Fopius arisanus]
MSLEDAETQENSPDREDHFTLLEELTDDPDTLPVVINDGDGTALQGVILEDHELLGATLTAVTFPDGTQAFVASHSSSPDLDYKEDEDLSHSIVIRDVAGLEGRMVHLEVDPVVLQSEPSTSNSSDTTYAQIQIINGSAYMVTSRLDSEPPKTKKKDSKLFSGESEIKIKYACPREGCSKVYTTPHHLKVHERSHTGLRPYECEFPRCNKSFLTGYSLKAHQRTHTGEKPYKCTATACEKSFKTSGDLLKHMRTHTGERPFPCPFEGCDRAFTTSNIRKVHIRTHTGERPYPCEICEKSFASATNYKNHMRIHSREKPYTCMVENCGKSFTEYSSLYKHRLVHTPAKPFECKLCHKSYRQHGTLVMHKRTTHALVDSDEGGDVFLDGGEVGLGRVKRKRSRQNKIMISKGAHVEMSEATEESSDSETQILLVGDPKQLVALQQMGLEETFDDPSIDTSLGLNVKIDGMEFGWN